MPVFNPNRAILASLGLAGMLLLWSAPVHPGSVPSNNHLRFGVFRGSLSVGTHDVMFERVGDRLIIQSSTDVSVGALFLTFYRFEQRRTEIRENGRVVFYESWTNNNGEELTTRAVATETGLEIEGMDGTLVVDAQVLLTTYWDVATVSQSRLIEGSYGRLIDVEIDKAGQDPIKTADGVIKAQHYRVRGELQRDLWYDADGVWLKMEFTVDDGSIIRYEPRV